MREMMSTGPGAICTGMHNEKGIGTRLLLTKLGGAERTTAEMSVVTADARNGKCALARLGRDADAMYGDGSKMARMAADAVFDANLKFSEFAFPSSNPGEKASAQNILCSLGPPVPRRRELVRDAQTFGALAQECMDHAEVYGVFTRFLFFHLGTTGDQEPVAGRRLFSVDPERGLLCNDVETPLSLCEFFRESYVPPESGLYPLTASDAADATKGRKEFTVQGAPVFDTPSFLIETHHDEGVLASDVMRIDCGNGRSMYMRAYWPTPENSNGSDRLKLHQNVQYATGTYLVYKDKILNPYHPKSLNLARKGEEDYYGKALSYVKGTNLGPVKKSLMGKDSAVRSWLGFKTWAEWTAYGLPSRRTSTPATTRTVSTRCSRLAPSSSCASTRSWTSTRPRPSSGTRSVHGAGRRAPHPARAGALVPDQQAAGAAGQGAAGARGGRGARGGGGCGGGAAKEEEAAAGDGAHAAAPQAPGDRDLPTRGDPHAAPWPRPPRALVRLCARDGQDADGHDGPRGPARRARQAHPDGLPAPPD